MADMLLRGVTRDATMRVVAAVATDTCAEGARRHGLAGVPAIALARGLTSGLLLATLTKGNERVSLDIAGQGSLGGVVVDASDTGDARGYVRGTGPALEGSGRGLLGPLIAPGLISVIRDLGLKEQYSGRTPLVSGEIDDDVEAYLVTSEQIPSLFAVEAEWRDGAIVSAAGLLVQTLPGGDEAGLAVLRAALETGGRDRLHGDAEALARTFVPDLVVLDSRPLRFHCHCSPERVARALTLLDAAELDEMQREGRAEVTCHFCGAVHHLAAAELAQIAAQVRGRGSPS